MKTFITLFCLAIASLLTAQSADEAAIKELCLTDTKAFVARDFATWQSCWHHSDQASLLLTAGARQQGWENVRSFMKKGYEAATEPRPVTPSHSNYFFNIQGDRAFVTFEQAMTTHATIGGEPLVSKTYEVRNLIKVDGEWKIFNQVTSPLRHEAREQDIIEYLNLAWNGLEKMERREDAVKITALLVDVFPDRPIGYWRMGSLAVEQKDKASALQYLEKAISLFGDGVPPGLQSLYEQAKALE